MTSQILFEWQIIVTKVVNVLSDCVLVSSLNKSFLGQHGRSFRIKLEGSERRQSNPENWMTISYGL